MTTPISEIRVALATWDNPSRGHVPHTGKYDSEGRDYRLFLTRVLREWCQQLLSELDLANERVAVKQAAYEQCAAQLVAERKERSEPIPMDDAIPTPLTDKQESNHSKSGYVATGWARSLERQLTISRRSCARLQSEIEKLQAENESISCARSVALKRIHAEIVAELNERIADMQRHLEDIEAAGRPHSHACECPCCEAWQAAYNYLHTLSTAPSCEGRNNENPPPELPGLTCPSQTEAAGHQPAETTP